MGRIEYIEIDDEESMLAAGRWEGRRTMALGGRPGRKQLAALEKALVAMPRHRLIEGALCDGTDMCAIGAPIYQFLIDSGESPDEALATLARQSKYSGEDAFAIAAVAGELLSMTETLAWVIQDQNDEPWHMQILPAMARETPEERYDRVLRWVRYVLAQPPLIRGSSKC